MMTDYNESLVDICNSNIIIYYYNNVTGCEEPSFNRNSNQLLQTDRASSSSIPLGGSRTCMLRV